MIPYATAAREKNAVPRFSGMKASFLRKTKVFFLTGGNYGICLDLSERSHTSNRIDA